VRAVARSGRKGAGERRQSRTHSIADGTALHRAGEAIEAQGPPKIDNFWGLHSRAS